MNGSNIDFEPNAGFGGSVTVNYTVTDFDGDSDSAVVTFIVDDIPIANGDRQMRYALEMGIGLSDGQMAFRPGVSVGRGITWGTRSTRP